VEGVEIGGEDPAHPRKYPEAEATSRLAAGPVFFFPMSKGTIGILTGGGDVPGLNPAIRAITIRALRDGYNVIGIRHGWGGLVDYSRAKDADNSEQIVPLTEAIVNRA